MLCSTTWNVPESKWSTSFPKARAIHRSLNLLRSHRLPPSTDETGPINSSESFFDLPHSVGGSLFPAAAALPGQFDLSPPSRNQRKPSLFAVHAWAAKEPSHCQHYCRPLSVGLLPRSANQTRGPRESPRGRSLPGPIDYHSGRSFNSPGIRRRGHQSLPRKRLFGRARDFAERTMNQPEAHFIFDWRKSRWNYRLPVLIAISFFAHLFCFYIFRVV